MSKTTYDSRCFKCLCGALHPFHDNGEIADGAEAVEQFSQLPKEYPRRESYQRQRQVREVRT